LVATPTELLKCRLQAQGDPLLAAQRLAAATAASGGGGGAAAASSTVALFRGPLDVARHVLKHERGVRGLYKGLFATFARESLGNVAMFGAYDAARSRAAARRGLSNPDELPFVDTLIAGGVGGTLFWFAAFPSDLVKSKLQTEPFDRPKFAGFWDCVRQTVRECGWGGLWRGFTPALLRAFPANAVCFAGYELAKERLSAAAFG
jgi:solute carrier family 25 (mitochondrial carnitine/acylcarnitine transporter), member 20/29